MGSGFDLVEAEHQLEVASHDLPERRDHLRVPGLGLGFGDWGCALGSKMYRSWFKVEGLEF